MSERPQRAAQRELAETLGLPLDGTGDRLSHEIFAHGLLLAHAEAMEPGAAAAADARVQRIMAALRAGAAASPEPIAFPGASSRPAWKKWLPAVAAAVVALGTIVIVSIREQPAYADEILERALKSTEEGVHIYKVSFGEKRTITRPTPAGPRVREHTTSSKWIAGLAPGGRWLARKIDGARWLLDGTEIGSDGKTMWVRARTGQAFELTLDPRGLEMMSLDPVLNYYQLHPFLKALFSKQLECTVSDPEPGPNGTSLRRITGTYAYDASREKIVMPAYRKRWRSFLLGTEGRLVVTVDADTARLMYLRLEQLAPRRRTLEVERQPVPSDPAAAGYDFDPPRVHTAPHVKLLVWILQAVRTWEEKRQARQSR